MVLAVFVIAVLASLDVLYDNTADLYEESSDGVGAIPTWSLSSTTVTGGGGGPTTTAPPGTTTTAPATTTTAAPTTTTTPAVYSFIDEIENRSFTESDGEWRARVRVNIHRDDTNANVVGALVSGLFTADNGSTRVKSCTTNTSGRCQMAWSNRQSYHSPMTFEVTNVVASPTWDGSAAAIVLVEP